MNVICLIEDNTPTTFATFSARGTLRKGEGCGRWVLDEVNRAGRPDGTRVFPLGNRRVEVYREDEEDPMLIIGPEGVEHCDCCGGSGSMVNAHEKIRCSQCNWGSS